MIERLYDSFKPAAYKLKLDIDSENLEFNGAVAIKGEVATDTSVIKLHAKELTILACSINGAEVDFSLDAASDVLELQPAEKMKLDTVEVAVEFRGKITDAMHGMYPCYFEHEGKQKKLIATQFESHHAREVFPCIDEPAAKAVFNVELITNAGEAVLCNTPIKTQTEESDRLITVFETTPILST